MALTAVEQWSTTAASNTTLGASITLDGTVMTPSQVDDGFRELMAQVATWRTAGTFTGSSWTLTYSDAGAAVGPTLTLYRDSASPAASDVIGAISYQGRDSAANAQVYAVDDVVITDPTSTSEDAIRRIRTVVAGTLTTAFQFASTGNVSQYTLVPVTDDGAALGTTSLEWSDLFLASGGVVNWNNGDVTLTHAANQLTFGGASQGYLFDAVTAPASNDGAPLGSTTNKWSDLFLALGAVINFNSGDVTLTHASGTLIYTGTITSNASSNTPGSGNNLSGVALDASGTIYASRGGQALIINRTSDGTVMQVNSGGTTQGSVSISGATVTWGTFTGAHWSQLANGAAKIDILRGTILETIDEMCDWFALSYVDHAGTPWLHEQGVPEGAKEGDSHVIAYDYEDEGETKRFTTTATVVRLRNDNLARFKVSDEAGSNAVYGVFGSYDPDFPNDVNIHAIGTDVIRLPAGVTPKRGDLIESKGDGCGRIQADNLFRASTVAKISAPIVVGEHPDGSRLFPCTLHCG